MRYLLITALIAGCALSASESGSRQRPKAFTCDPDNGGLTLPAGFCAGVIADNLGTARNLVVAANGDLFVSVRSGASRAGAASAARVHPRPARFGWRRQDRHAGEVRNAGCDRHQAAQRLFVLLDDRRRSNASR